MLVHIVLINVFSSRQESLYGANIHLARQQSENIIANVVMDFAYNLSGELLVDSIVEVCRFFLDEWEKVGSREVSLHFFELRNEPVSQFGRLFVQNLLFAVFTKYFNAGGLKNDIYILVPFGDFGSEDFFFVFKVAVNNWEGSV